MVSLTVIQVTNDFGLKDERAIARNRLLLEKEYANPTNSGYTYVGANGDKFPLTPVMLNEWSRAIVSRAFLLHPQAFSDNSFSD